MAERTADPAAARSTSAAMADGGEGARRAAPHRRGVLRVIDRDQFLLLVEQHTPAVLKLTSALVGFADAEDAAQEAVLQAWRARESLRNPAALRSWLLQIAVNVCRQWHRGRFGLQRRSQLPLTPETLDLLATLDADPGAINHAAALDLRQAINDLELPLRLVVVLRYYGGMDATEIGSAMHVSPATIRTRLRRALFLLRLSLRDSGRLHAAHQEEGGTHV